MPSTYTTNNGIELIGTGEQSGTWGDTTNTNLTLVDASLDGHTSITLATAGTSGSPNDVPITDGATSNGRNRALIFTDGSDLGGSVYVRLTPNDSKKIMFVRNSLSGSRDLILFQGTYNASNDFVLAAGKDAIVKFDGGGSGAVASAVLEDFALDAATITTISNTTLNTATVNATTVDTTNIEVTNLKAKDGVSAGSIANSTGVVTLDSSVLTTTDINGGTVDGVTLGTNSAVTEAQIDNININGNAITSTNTNGNIALTPDGTGEVDISKVDIASGTIDGVTIGGSSAGVGTFTTVNATTVDTTNIEVTNLKAKDGTSAGSIADSTGVVTLASSVLTTTDINGGSVDGVTLGTNSAVTEAQIDNININGNAITSTDTNGNIDLTPDGTGEVNISKVDINGGAIDGVTIGGSSAGTGTFTTANATTVDTTNLEVTNLKAKDGTSAGSIANSTGVVTLASSVLTTTDINGGTIDGTTIGGSSAAAITGTTGVFSGDLTVDTDTLHVDAADNRVGINTTSPAQQLHVDGGARIGSGGGAHGDGDDLVITKDQENVGVSILCENDTGTSRLFLGSQTFTRSAKIQHTESSGLLTVQAESDLRLQTGGENDRVTVDSSGNVGIGLTNPTQPLNVSGKAKIGTGAEGPANGDELVITKNQANTGLSILSAEGTGNSRIFFGGQTNNNVAKIQHTESTGDLTVQAESGLVLQTGGNSDRVTVDSSGNVGIGTSSPSDTLNVDGTAKIGTGASAHGWGDDLFVSKVGTNVGVSILCEDATGSARLFLGSQSETRAAKIQHSESSSILTITSEGDMRFQTGGTTTNMTLDTSGDLDVVGALSKGSGSFKIDHPLKPETHHLIHSFIEGPQADNLYRGTVALVGGTATVNLDTAGRMTEGTFVALNGNVQCFTSNEDGWTAVKGSVSGNVLTISAQDATCTDTVSWMVVGERHDQHMLDTAWTDAEGRVITEPTKPPAEEDEVE